MRIKPKSLYPIKDLIEANVILGKIAQLKRDIICFETDAQNKIDHIKDITAGKIHPLAKEINKLELSLSAFGHTNKDELFKDYKTAELNFGFIGFRKSTKITIVRQTLKLLKQLKYLDAIITKESVNKDALATYPAEKLAEVKAKRKSEDKFWYEIKTDTKS